MLNWKNASNHDLKLLKAIKMLFGDDEKFLNFLFHPTRSKLSDSPENLKERMACFSSGEQLLLLVAMDIWGTYGGIHFDDLYTKLCPQSLQNCLHALAYLKRNLYS